MRRHVAPWAVLAAATLVIAAAGMPHVGDAARTPAAIAKNCPPGYVDANLSWGEKCLHAGEFCKVGNPEYHQYGFDCPPDGHLATWSGAAPPATTTTSVPPITTTSATASLSVGRTVLLARKTRSSGCRRGALPDRRCSPGAYYSGLTQAVICSTSFRTSTIRNVPQSEKFADETEYGMTPRSYGHTIEIDHIVSLELGGSNEIANLFPEPGSGPADYHVKDRLENRLHDMVCAGQIALRAAQREIAGNWETLYQLLYGVVP